MSCTPLVSANTHTMIITIKKGINVSSSPTMRKKSAIGFGYLASRVLSSDMTIMQQARVLFGCIQQYTLPDTAVGIIYIQDSFAHKKAINSSRKSSAQRNCCSRSLTTTIALRLLTAIAHIRLADAMQSIYKDMCPGGSKIFQQQLHQHQLQASQVQPEQTIQ